MQSVLMPAAITIAIWWVVCAVWAALSVFVILDLGPLSSFIGAKPATGAATAPFKYLNVFGRLDVIVSAGRVGALVGGTGRLLFVGCVNFILGLIGWAIIITVAYQLFRAMQERR